MKRKNVLILGAKSDIAKALADLYAKKGYNLSLACRNGSERLKNLQSDLKIRYNAEADIYDFDAISYKSHKDFYQGLIQKPDIAISVFGYLGKEDKARTDFDEAHRIIDTNYTGVVSILNIIACDFEERKSGTIVGISSVAGERGRGSNYHYGSAKAGLSAYLSGLRNHLFKSGVHVVSVKPGFVNTSMTEGMPLPGPVTAQPGKVAKDIFKAVEKKKNVIYTLWMWRYIMLIIKSVPEFIFKKLSL